MTGLDAELVGEAGLVAADLDGAAKGLFVHADKINKYPCQPQAKSFDKPAAPQATKILGVMPVIPERVIERREALGIRHQAELARRVGVSAQSIQQLEAGDVRNPTYIIRLAEALETTPRYLQGETDSPNGPPGNQKLTNVTQPLSVGSHQAGQGDMLTKAFMDIADLYQRMADLKEEVDELRAAVLDRDGARRPRKAERTS